MSDVAKRTCAPTYKEAVFRHRLSSQNSDEILKTVVGDRLAGAIKRNDEARRVLVVSLLGKDIKWNWDLAKTSDGGYQVCLFKPDLTIYSIAFY